MTQLKETPTNHIGHFGFLAKSLKNTLRAKTLAWFDDI